MKSKFRGGFLAMMLLVALFSAAPQADQTYWVCSDAQGNKVAQDHPCDPSNPSKNRREARPNVVPAVTAPVTVPADLQGVQSNVQSVVQQARDRMPAVSPGAIRLLLSLGLAVLALLALIAVWGQFARLRRNRAQDKADGAGREAGGAQSRLPLLGRPKDWSPLLIGSLGARRLEELCAALWTMQGYRTEPPGTGTPGGVSLLCFKSDPAGKPAVIIQCKAAANGSVNVTAVRELFGNIGEFGAKQAVLVTASDFDADAKVFSGGKPLELIDGAMLLQKLRALPDGPQRALLKQIARRGYRA